MGLCQHWHEDGRNQRQEASETEHPRDSRAMRLNGQELYFCCKSELFDRGCCTLFQIKIVLFYYPDQAMKPINAISKHTSNLLNYTIHHKLSQLSRGPIQIFLGRFVKILLCLQKCIHKNCPDFSVETTTEFLL